MSPMTPAPRARPGDSSAPQNSGIGDSHMRGEYVRRADPLPNPWRSRAVAKLMIICVAVRVLGGAAAWSQSADMIITLTGQAMIRSDLRATAPAAVPRIKSLLKG